MSNNLSLLCLLQHAYQVGQASAAEPMVMYLKERSWSSTLGRSNPRGQSRESNVKINEKTNLLFYFISTYMYMYVIMLFNKTQKCFSTAL